ncbi:hypothetical protein IWQ60_009405 [Tieghemiomyces parasiticus]|uniref:Uncharacterized protein n=1 Tax=Tieghemiomyces parasiticus TaxID=78921 RepID=A0A9W8DL71_9FUNG|nr:hypothetical protein IWQ60_009405 [Tieghemiomyces parasiticus]
MLSATTTALALLAGLAHAEMPCIAITDRGHAQVTYLIHFRDSNDFASTSASFNKNLDCSGGAIEDSFEFINSVKATFPATLLPSVEKDPRVAFVEEDGVITTQRA